MPKYHLVASYYDLYEKNPNLKYKNEIEINIPGIDLSTLQAIDSFTASHSKLEIIDLLNDELGITGRNSLAIKYQKNKTANPVYYKIIENNQEFIPCTKNNNLISYYVGDKFVRTLAVHRTPLFVKELSVLGKIIYEKNLEEFERLYSYPNSDLYYLVTRFINTSYDTPEAEIEDLKLIEKEFSRYKTFRGWIIAKENKKNYQNKENAPQEKAKIKENGPVAKNKKTVQSIEKYSEEYEQYFDEKHKNMGITYKSKKTHQYNTRGLDHDEEEFLNEGEMRYIEGDYYDQSEDTTTRKRRR